MTQTRQTMTIDVTQRLKDHCVKINTFLQNVINEWSIDCQHKTNAEIAKSLELIQQLESDFHQAIGAYIKAVANELDEPVFDDEIDRRIREYSVRKRLLLTPSQQRELCERSADMDEHLAAFFGPKGESE